MKEHMGSRHGVFFQQDWKRHCSQHCRYTVLATANLCSLQYKLLQVLLFSSVGMGYSDGQTKKSEERQLFASGKQGFAHF